MTPGKLDLEVEEAVPRLLSLAVDDNTRQTCLRNLLVQGCRLVAAEGEDFLFELPPIVREDYQQYRMFLRGHLLEVRRMGFFSSEFSMVDFPQDLASCRPDIESRFADLWRRTDEFISFSGRPWDDLTGEQQAVLACKFVDDNMRYFNI